MEGIVKVSTHNVFHEVRKASSLCNIATPPHLVPELPKIYGRSLDLNIQNVVLLNQCKKWI